jgi:ADP-ribose pyrophosphatase YjhB (NUDIX family)
MKNSDLNLIKNWFGDIDATKGIGQDLFLQISQLTPMMNVDLIIKSKDMKMNLLSWRDDKYYGPGWHIPGSVVRFKEKMVTTIKRISDKEIKSDIDKIKGPLGYHELFNNERNIRGHFVSFVYIATLKTEPITVDIKIKNIKNGDLCWFKNCPDNLIKNQIPLKKYLETTF